MSHWELNRILMEVWGAQVGLMVPSLGRGNFVDGSAWCLDVYHRNSYSFQGTWSLRELDRLLFHLIAKGSRVVLLAVRGVRRRTTGVRTVRTVRRRVWSIIHRRVVISWWVLDWVKRVHVTLNVPLSLLDLLKVQKWMNHTHCVGNIRLTSWTGIKLRSLVTLGMILVYLTILS